MRRTGVVVVTDDVEVIASLIRVGCAAIQASPISATDGVGMMRRQRLLKIGSAFLAELELDEETYPGQLDLGFPA